MFNFHKKTDLQIQNDVMTALKWDPRVADKNLVATTRQGIVTLRGTVPHHSEKAMAEQAVQRVGGVRAVADEIEVELLGTYERSDEDIARTALMALDWNYSVPVGVKVVVDNGWVTLTGEAEWDYERMMAKQVVSALMGVRGVTNDITMKKCAQPADLKTRIEEALKRSAENEGRKITVAVEGNLVTLSGDVHSISEVEEASLAVWEAPGVGVVKNNLRVVD